MRRLRRHRHTELHLDGRVPPAWRGHGPPLTRAARPQGVGPRLEFPTRETSDGRRARVCRSASRAPGDARAGGRRAGARRGGAGGRSPRATTRRPLPRQSGQRRRDPARQRPVPAAFRDRVVRPRRATSSCTRTCCVTDLLRLVRINNLLLAAAGVLAGGWIALGAVRTPNVLALAAVAAVGVAMAGNVLNDIWDQAADRVNRSGGGHPLAPGRVPRGTADLCVAGGAVIGLGAAAFVSGTA